MTKARVNNFWVSGFTADTPVVMANGKIKPISKVQEGEWVASFDPMTKERIPGQVINTWSEVMNDMLEVTVDDKSMVVASSQLFYTPEGEFKTAPDAGTVMTMDGLTKSIQAKRFGGGKVKLYDITVKDSHAFYANGLMVHNKGKKSSPPPAPPPDPVVTAGKVGQPLTVRVNGTNVMVNPPAGAVATVSVNYAGGASTGYHSVPGLATINVPMPIPSYPAVNYGSTAYAYLESASVEQIGVCDSMANSSASVSSAAKRTWTDALDRLKTNVQQADRNDRLWWAVPSVRFSAFVYAPRDLVYTDTVNDINDLKKFVSKEKNLTAGDRAFIAAKCAKIAGQISHLQNRIRPTINVAVPQPATNTNGSGDRIYSTNPSYAYATKIGNLNGCEAYNVRPPNANSSGPTYYKHFDTTNGQFYLSLNSDNCV